MRNKISRDREEELAEDSGRITVREAGRRGGRATVERLGAEFFRQIGRKGGRRTAELYAALLSDLGKKGGRPRRPRLNESTGKRDRD